MGRLDERQRRGDALDTAPLRWVLRPILPDEFEWAFSLHRDAMGEYIEQTWGWDEEDQRRRLSERFDGRPRQVIEVDGESVGVLEVEERPDQLYVALIEITPAWQGRGIGGEILRWLARRAEESQRPLRLYALKANPRALAFYERHGLRIVGTEELRLLMST